VDRRGAGGRCQSGLAAFGVVELDFGGRSGEVLAEEVAEGGASGDVSVAVAMEGEAVSAGVFVGGEGGFPGDLGEALRVVGEAPDMYLAGC
jgi:hypothetical protein